MKIPQSENVDVNSIKTDGSNPNVMTDAQMTALKRNIEKYGFLIPIITNKDLVIADGEHRLQAAKELSMTEVPVIKLDVAEVDRRILRQVLNKLRGEHDAERDIQEYFFFKESNALEELTALLAIDKKEIEYLIAPPDFVPASAKDQSTLGQLQEKKCPKCGFVL